MAKCILNILRMHLELILLRIFDLHCDTLTEIYDRNLAFRNNETAVNAFLLNKFKESIIQYAVWFKGNEQEPFLRLEKILEYANSQLQNSSTKKHLFSVENGWFLRTESDVEKLSKLGIVSATLTWNYDNALAGGVSNYGELSLRGKEIIKAFNRYNIALDLAHLNEKSFYKAAELADRVLCSHTGLKNLVNHRRSITNEQVLYLKNRGGIIGISVYPEFIGNDVKSGFLDAVEHLFSLGCEDIIAFGSDFDGAKMGDEINNIKDSIKLNKFLEEKIGKTSTEKVFYGNAKTFFDKSLQKL